MPEKPVPEPGGEPPPPAPPSLDITDEEWIAASQSCCGAEPESDCRPRDEPEE
jgi:hypothetical protein